MYSLSYIYLDTAYSDAIIVNMFDQKNITYEGIVPLDKQEEIKNLLYSSNFPWFYHPRTVKTENNSDLNIFESYQFTHTFYRYVDSKGCANSHFINIPNTLLNLFLYSQGIDQCEVLRCRVNLQTAHSSAKNKYNTPHNDLDVDHYVLLYYADSSDSFTYLFDDNGNITECISSEQGKFCIFSGKTKHAGSHPVFSENRCVINFNIRF